MTKLLHMRYLLLFFATIRFIVCEAQKYTGYVYLDKNRNGLFDSGDKKLKGVAVSDGLNPNIDKKLKYAVEAATGKTLWETADWPHALAATTNITYANNKIFSGIQWGSLNANLTQGDAIIVEK